MTKIFKIILLSLLVGGCSFDKPEYRFKCVGKLNSLRIDDDSEYHFSSDFRAIHDLRSYYLIIERDAIKTPMLYVKEGKCPKGKFCNEYQDYWKEVSEFGDDFSFIKYKVVLPLDYKIETFDD